MNTEDMKLNPHFIMGEMMAIQLVKRGKNDNHICLLLWMEDDEWWSEVSHIGSSFWIDDLLEVVTKTKNELEGYFPDTYGPHDRPCGFKFKKD